MQKWAMFSLIIVACLLGAGVLFQDISARQAEMAQQEAAGPQLRFVATNYQFDQAEYTVKAGEKVTVSLVNKEGLHAMEIVGTSVKLDNNTKTMEITFDKPGEYQVHCSLPCGPGHAEMITKLIVQ
ncbi:MULTISPECIES: cupredoxin domain-containing protein [unclassified Paenibacillus]|uniref:cupredoxin domain-containing protein n=1 Tax=unclassified Paenibacillus TaxID=185978 RepID=UPI001AE230AE|nr:MULTISPECIES: cupredoxin domain-containing protein [unclassified Paenibacillus]MBP1155178.1 cytochrome c oxidase subunit 2 [Paenibacillus sp. PvP091]MBP1169438.1 cytochrome c oxidase subunit 2 [Paenibacillus sp. PvR098]MBP2440466.1 cytochrome c oxidase subunit 2 [Paenibacillus sp. PvP052]